MDKTGQGTIVFGIEWFEKHQKGLLWLCNHPILKYWFRLILRIHRDVKFSQRIAQIQPNNYKVVLGVFFENKQLKSKIRADFRTHNKFSARLYHAFKPIWWCMHFLDWICLDDLDYSFGFSTLTTYPATGGGTTCDGIVRRSGVDQTFADIIAGAGTSTSTALCQVQNRASGTTDQFDILDRNIATFETNIGSGVTITSLVISPWGTAKVNDLGGTMNLVVVSATPASDSSLANADYGQLGSISFGSVTYADYVATDSAYTDITLNASGIANINMTTISRFGFKTSDDFNGTFSGTWSNGASNRFGWRPSSTAGTSNDMKLVIVYATVYTVDVEESLTIDESFSYLRTRNKSLAEPIDINQTIQKLTTREINEPIDITQSVATARSFLKSFTESMKITETIQKSISKIIEESIEIAQTFTKYIQKIIEESLKITESIVKSWQRNISIAESITIRETARRFLNGITVGRWTKRGKESTIWTRQQKR